MIDEFNEILDMPYDEFLDALQNPEMSSDKFDLMNLAMTAMTPDYKAIKLSFERTEGLQETQVEYILPKVYVMYINATSAEKGEEPLESNSKDKEVVEEDFNLATARLRDTLRKMRTLHKDLPKVVMDAKNVIDRGGSVGDTVPPVKSIICANLMLLSRNKTGVIAFVFDQIYGKLVHKIKLLNGEDVYIPNYTERIAPAGSYKNDKGIYIKENKQIQLAIIAGMARQGGKYAGLKEYVEDDV